MAKIKLEMSLIHLLAILLSYHNAHAAPTEISLHNNETVKDSSAVRNWTLLCQDLCSLSISGPACGLDCGKIPVNEDLKAKSYNISEDDQEELCEELCEYGLGDNQCECKVPIIPAEFKPAVHRPDKYKICADACRFYHVTLKSCSPCPFEEHGERRGERYERFYNKNPIKTVAQQFSKPTQSSLLTPQIPVPQSALPSVFRPNPQSALPFQHQQYQQTTTDSTTPDWNKLCAQLCRNGTGGLLCNCDLPPF